MSESPIVPVRPPSVEAFWTESLFEVGIGWVMLARFKSKGERVEAGIFLVDVYCLGVKNAVYADTHPLGYREIIKDYLEGERPVVPVDPACARKVVEQAIAYARRLGFEPHPDYKKAARVFGGVRADECSRGFTFGYEGKPFYCQGPNESPEQTARILWQLEQRCGAGNYNFLSGREIIESEEDEEQDKQAPS